VIFSGAKVISELPGHHVFGLDINNLTAMCWLIGRHRRDLRLRRRPQGLRLDRPDLGLRPDPRRRDHRRGSPSTTIADRPQR
jgi:hypothetical protein